MRSTIKHIRNAFNFLSVNTNYKYFKNQLIQKVGVLNQQKKITSKKRLLAVYDFLELPYTSDICVFLMNADAERRLQGCEKMDVMFVTCSEIPANPNYEKRINNENYRHLIHNLGIEYLRMFDNVGSFFLIDGRNQSIELFNLLKCHSFVFPQDYNPNYPFERSTIFERPLIHHSVNISCLSKKDRSYNALRPPKQALQLAQKWIMNHVYPKIPITITLRESQNTDPERSNSLAEWQKLVDAFKDDERYKFIVLRDYYNLYDDECIVGKNVVYCNEAVISLTFRAALHELATLNLFIPNGVNVVSLFSNKTRYIKFKILTPGVHVTSEYIVKGTSGLNVGEQWAGSTKYQRMVWCNDDFEVLFRETNQMLSILDEDEQLIPKFYDSKVCNENNSGLSDKCELMHSKKVEQKLKSVISVRTPISYYIKVFKALYYFRLLKFFYCTLFNRHPYKVLSQREIKPNEALVFYGYGTVTQALIKAYREQTIAIVDKNINVAEQCKHNDISVEPINALSVLNFDYLVVTPQGRELDIIEDLSKSFNIPKNKFLVASDMAYRP
ncbi:hypothetical protein [Catenovulum sediminis]|uniref:RCK N-terminal domain-containing protein n=1 Tax=Catenovulum sediminis TaxID=1740262 RepID=A0ABV1RGY6_9ALTE